MQIQTDFTVVAQQRLFDLIGSIIFSEVYNMGDKINF